MRRGLLGGAAGLLAAGVGGVLVADRRVAGQRRVGAAALDRFAATVPQRSGFVRASDGVELYYEQDGADGAAAPLTVVLVHGFCLDHTTFVLARRALRAHHPRGVRVIVYDQRSHGRSGRSTPAHATIERLGDDLRVVLAATAPTGPLVLVGHSMGGMTIMALLAQRPYLFGPAGRVRGVLLADTSSGRLAAVSLGLPALAGLVGGPVGPLRPLGPLSGPVIGGVRRGWRVLERGRAQLTDVAWVLVKRLSFGPDADPGLVEFVARAIDRTGLDVIADFYPALMRHDKLGALPLLAGTPTVIVCGDDDLITPPEHSRTIADALPDARLTMVPGTGHLALLERPDLFDAALNGLLDAALPAKRAAR